MSFILSVGQKIRLESCVESARIVHPHIWQINTSQRNATVIDTSYIDIDKTFVCFKLENSFNTKPSPVELGYFASRKSEKNLHNVADILLIEAYMLVDKSVVFMLHSDSDELYNRNMTESDGLIDDASIELLTNVLGITRPVAMKLLDVFGSVEDALDNYDAFMESEDAESSISLSAELANVYTTLPEAPSSTSTSSKSSLSSSSTTPPPPPTPPVITALPVKPPKPSIFSGLFGKRDPLPPISPPAPPPPPSAEEQQQEQIDQLVGILSVSPKVAKRLLTKHKQDVTEAITHYFGLSSREQSALETDSSSSMEGPSSSSSSFKQEDEWDTFETFLTDSDSRGHIAKEARRDEQAIHCGKCEQTVHYLPPNLYKGGWKCDWPAHQGKNMFQVTTGFYCCAGLETCDFMVCEGCFMRDSHDFSGSDGQAFEALKTRLTNKKMSSQSAVKDVSKSISVSNPHNHNTSLLDLYSDDEDSAITLENNCWSPAESESDASSSYFQTTPSTRDSLYSSQALSTKSSVGAVTPLAVPSIALPVKTITVCNVCKKSVDSHSVIALQSCEHSVCSDCLSKHLEASRALRRDPTAIHHPVGVKVSSTQSLFIFNALPALPVPHSFESFTLPALRKDIHCPVNTCKHCLVEEDVQNQAPYNADWEQSNREAAACVSEMRSYQVCCMSGVVCEDGPQPVSQFIQLGCNHFFHHDCLAPSLRTKIEKERLKTKPQVIICPKCEDSASEEIWCDCMTCGGKRKHVVNDQEIRGLVECATCDFTERDKQNWLSTSFKAFSERLSAKQSQLIGSEDSDYDDCGEERLVPVTCVCGVLYFTDADSSHVTCTNATCKAVICITCMKKAHFGQTCAEAVASQTTFNESTLDLAGLGIILQYCPFCNTPGDRPKDCLHITCVCSEQFCFLCAAPYTPAYSHSTAYHRPQCSLHEVCCDEQCFDKGKTVCVTDKFQPGPCSGCKNTVNHNTCTHNANWKACKKCVDKHIHCLHWCNECAKLGKLCSPPSNPQTASGKLRYKIITHEAVKRAESEEIAKRGNK